MDAQLWIAILFNIAVVCEAVPTYWPLFRCPKHPNTTFSIQQMCDGYDDCGDSSDECGSMCRQTFRCQENQTCLALDRFCNGVMDCDDGSDEMLVDFNQPNTTERFYCHNFWNNNISRDRTGNMMPQNYARQCYLPEELLCDGINHCGDHSDECNDRCSNDTYFVCDNGKCIAGQHRCDDVDDCGDGSDECPGCPSSFTCDDETCIAAEKFCDGHMDCKDGSDERHLSNTTLDNEVACKSVHNHANDICVIPTKYVCDGYEQCLHREDECVDGCESYSFKCNNGICIISDFTCNGVDDCGDMSDECSANCKNTFTCGNGLCISMDKFCDGIMDCDDGSDEVAMATEKNETSIITPSGLYCANPKSKTHDYLCLLPNKYMCDGLAQCFQRVDECQDECDQSFFCDGGKTCIERSTVCDGKHQCNDGMDEPKSTTALANLRGFKCFTSRYGLVKPCVLPQVMVNDSIPDCDQDTDVCHLPTDNTTSESRCWRCARDTDIVISRRQVCDGNFDCPDLSDECLCQDVKATSVCQKSCFGEFCDSKDTVCPYGTIPCLNPGEPVIYPVVCIPTDKFCDGVYDCQNEADEACCGESKICSSSSEPSNDDTIWTGDVLKPTIQNHCKRDHICSKHMAGNPYTPMYASACDGRPECFDLEDECDESCHKPLPEFCNFRNSEGFFTCPEGGVFPGVVICDGLKNCTKTSQDELECPGRFYCHSGELISVEEFRRCDLVVDCFDASDEAECNNTHFYCEKGDPFFVPIRQKFDGKNDCLDGSDECPASSFDSSIFSSRENLIDNPFLKGMVWVMGILSISGNSFVMINTVRSFSQQSKKLNNMAQIFNFLVFNLAVADLIMGLFLIMLGIKSSLMSGKYCRMDKGWRSGNMCKLLGVMATISSETSIVILGILSTYRLMCVVRPVQGRSCTVRTAAILTGITWLITTSVALFPIFPPLDDYFVTSAWLAPNPFFLEDVVDKDDMTIFSKIASGYMSQNNSMSREHFSWKRMSQTLRDVDPRYVTYGYFGFYSTHGVCLPKIFVNHDDISWKYSVMLMVFNFTMFLYIVIAYIRVSRPNKIQKRRKNSSSSVATRNMQRRIAMLVATDFACWMPTCMIGFIKLAGAPVPGMVYAFAAIVLLPINSALNPILYSDSIQNVCLKIVAAFSWAKDKIERDFKNQKQTRIVESSVHCHKDSGAPSTKDTELETML